MDNAITVMLYVGLACMMYSVSKYAFYSKYKLNKSVAWFAMLMLPSLVAAFRNGTGTDSKMYQQAYAHLNSVHRWQDFEKGYLFLMKVLNEMLLSYRALFFVMMFFTILFFLLLLENEKKNIDVQTATFVFMITLYLSCFNGMRQGLAITMLLYAMSIFIDGKTKQSICIIILAMLFHLSAMIGLAIIIGKYIFKNKYWKLFLFAGCGVLIYLITHRELLGRLVYQITASGYYASYVTRDSASESNLLVYLMKICFPTVFGFAYMKLYVGETAKMKIYYAMMLCGYTFSALNLITMTYVGRAGDYFSYLYIVLMGFYANNSLPLLKRKIKSCYIRILIIAYYMLFFFHQFVYKGFNDLIPYKGWFGVE